MKQRVVILVPTYNESENITLLIEDIVKNIKSQKKTYDFFLLFVDDNSPDGTGKLIKQFMKKDKSIYLLQGEKQGLGSAMIRGYKYALSKLQADIVITNEADFAFENKHIAYMLRKISDGYDVVVGSRHVSVGKTEGWTFSRKLNHWVANTVFATWVAGINEVYDHNGAFRAIRTKGVLDQLDWETLPSKGFSFFFYMMYELTKLTDKFHEFPVTYRFRTRGESKVSFNVKYIRTYTRDVFEYISLAFQVRYDRCKIYIWR